MSALKAHICIAGDHAEPVSPLRRLKMLDLMPDEGLPAPPLAECVWVCFLKWAFLLGIILCPGAKQMTKSHSGASWEAPSARPAPLPACLLICISLTAPISMTLWYLSRSLTFCSHLELAGAPDLSSSVSGDVRVDLCCYFQYADWTMEAVFLINNNNNNSGGNNRCWGTEWTRRAFLFSTEGVGSWRRESVDRRTHGRTCDMFRKRLMLMDFSVWIVLLGLFLIYY